MRIRLQNGTEANLEPTDEELRAIINDSLDTIRTCSSIVECEVCGIRVIVNNQDFHQVRRCPAHR